MQSSSSIVYAVISTPLHKAVQACGSFFRRNEALTTFDCCGFLSKDIHFGLIDTNSLQRSDFGTGGVMIRSIGAFCFFLVASTSLAEGLPPSLSGPLTKVESLPDAWLRVGFAADSQLQTRANYKRVFGYRGPFEDFVVKTAIRPPALDWAARSMLRSNLDQLYRQGAQAIFYLGDGANNGCYDEFALGFQDGSLPAPNDQGVLALLDEFREFRRDKGIPIFFILGNHDLLGAGSTAASKKHKDLCVGVTGGRVTKLKAMELTDAFNRGNAAIAPAWRYHSNWNADAVGKRCGKDETVQHRTPGCYLAATVDYIVDSKSAQFLLLDTNDWADVSKSRFLGLDQEGIRGAMSFVNDPQRQIVSQTRWFDENASSQVSLRVALSHYNVAQMVKRVPFIGGISNKTQLYMNLFTKGTKTRLPIQDQAFVVTGHTHTHEVESNLFTFKTDCGPIACAKTNRFGIRELNVGSTTDYSNYVTLAQFGLGLKARGPLLYSRIESEPTGCDDVWNAIPTQPFPYKLRGIDKGWKAIGIDLANRRNYPGFGYEDVKLLWANLDAYAGQDSHKANCVGLYAAAVEAKIEPPRGLPPRR